jgi:hypothetical protein
VDVLLLSSKQLIISSRLPGGLFSWGLVTFVWHLHRLHCLRSVLHIKGCLCWPCS